MDSTVECRFLEWVGKFSNTFLSLSQEETGAWKMETHSLALSAANPTLSIKGQ